MTIKIKLSKCLLAVCILFNLSLFVRTPIDLVLHFQRIEKNKTNTGGLLFGLIHSNELLVLGFSLNRSIENNLPAGVKECGHIKWGPKLESDNIESGKVIFFLLFILIR